jgi:hypothetical protein
MTLVLSELYFALREAKGVTEEQARAAAAGVLRGSTDELYAALRAAGVSEDMARAAIEAVAQIGATHP